MVVIIFCGQTVWSAAHAFIIVDLAYHFRTSNYNNIPTYNNIVPYSQCTLLMIRV